MHGRVLIIHRYVRRGTDVVMSFGVNATVIRIGIFNIVAEKNERRREHIALLLFGAFRRSQYTVVNGGSSGPV